MLQTYVMICCQIFDNSIENLIQNVEIGWILFILVDTSSASLRDVSLKSVMAPVKFYGTGIWKKCKLQKLFPNCIQVIPKTFPEKHMHNDDHTDYDDNEDDRVKRQVYYCLLRCVRSTPSIL